MATKKPHPPQLGNRLLCWLLKHELREEVLGDLEEQFTIRSKSSHSLKNKMRYWYEVLNYLRPFAIKNLKSKHSNNKTMFLHYLKISHRNLLRNKGYSLINISGLAIGLSVAIVIGLWIHDELTFNKIHGNYDQIGQVFRTGTIDNTIYTTEYLPFALVDEIKEKHGAGMKYVVPAWPRDEYILSVNNEKINEFGTYIGKEGPEMFSFHMLQGNLNGLNDPYSIMLSSTAAYKLFGAEDPINQVLKINNEYEVKVTGVFKDFPNNSRFHNYHFFSPWSLCTIANSWITDQGFTNNFLNLYVQLLPTSDFEIESDNIKNAILSNVGDSPEYVQINPQLFIYPMDQWHLFGKWENGKAKGGLIIYVRLFGLIGIFVLLLACINFMNLSTARSEKRAKEVGIRKSIGSIKKQLIAQFFTESLVLVVLSFVFAWIIAAISLSWFNEIANKTLEMPYSLISFWGVCIIFILFTAIIAGSYPALYLSSFNPIKVLKGTFNSGRGAKTPRRVLVIVQFSISIVLIIGTTIIFQQIQHAKSRPVGYENDNLVMIPMSSQDFYDKYDVIRTEIMKLTSVYNMSKAQGPVTQIHSTNGGFEWPGKSPGAMEDFGTICVSPQHGNTVGWKFLQGRDFNELLTSDSSSIIINQAAAKVMGLEDPIGEEVKWTPSWKPAKKYTIIGVIKDVIMESPYGSPRPSVFYLDGFTSWIHIKLNQVTDTHQALDDIAAVFKTNIPEAPFNYRFADLEYNHKFNAEERIGKLATIFSALAIFISCLGLLGLASFVAEQKTKEIGVRKILGASILSLWTLISREFFILIIIAMLISIPIVYYLMDSWLDKFEYRIEITWWVFVFAALGALVVTLITVSYQAIKAALMNPVKSLRSE